MSQSYALLESILWKREVGYWLLDNHLTRLKNSCEVLGFPYDSSRMTAALDGCLSDVKGDHYKTRFELNREGEIRYKAEAITPIAEDAVWKIAVAPQRLNKDNKLIYHKTTKRDLYDEALEWGKATHGVNEVLLLNKEDEICEGSYCNVFIKKDNMLITPPKSCGLLAGTLRGQLLREGQAIEEKISMEMLLEYPIYIGNSVRGLIRAQLIS